MGLLRQDLEEVANVPETRLCESSVFRCFFKIRKSGQSTLRVGKTLACEVLNCRFAKWRDLGWAVHHQHRLRGIHRGKCDILRHSEFFEFLPDIKEHCQRVSEAPLECEYRTQAPSRFRSSRGQPEALVLRESRGKERLRL